MNDPRVPSDVPKCVARIQSWMPKLSRKHAALTIAIALLFQSLELFDLLVRSGVLSREQVDDYVSATERSIEALADDGRPLHKMQLDS